jgi:hypothetical protein
VREKQARGKGHGEKRKGGGVGASSLGAVFFEKEER